MKYKKIIILILFCSIVLNLLQFYNIRKYRKVFNNSVQISITNIFTASEALEPILIAISKSGETSNLQLEELNEWYGKLTANIEYLGRIANIYNSKNEKIWNIQSYVDVHRDLIILTSKYETKEPNSIVELSNDDIIWIKKLMRHIDDIGEIGNRYSYIEDDMRYYRLDEWIDIYRELSKFSYYNFNDNY